MAHDQEEEIPPRLVLVPLTSIRISASNPRTDGERELDGLALALEAGLVQPPTLVEIRPGEYEVELGERRVRAAAARGWAEVPAIIAVPRPPIVAHQRRLVENLHRRDLRPLDEARALKLGWLCANATEMGLTSATNAALEEAGSVRAGLRGDVPGVPLRGVALLAVASLAGLLVGALVGRLIPRGVQLAAGGHRGLTHSLLVGAILAAAGLALDRQGLPVLGVVPLALAWGLVCHVVGDVVTPAGIRPLLPISDWTLRLPLGRFGEPIIALVAIVVGWVLIRG
jgi:membrane-bound metal-dependent hydrolase YbcI (DUF457 family)